MKIIEIRSRWDNKVLFSVEAETLSAAVEAAIRGRANISSANLSRADLSRANLSRADLSRADLSSANLSRANLSGADLSRADLSSADLSRANLSGADLSGANLSGANLYGADLSGADLSGANLSRADLSSADLSGADLSGANLYGAIGAAHVLKPVRDDIRKILDVAPGEVGGLLQSLWDGKVDGTAYEGECACLVGTIAKVRGVAYRALPGLVPDSDRPAERWFYSIRQGDTPVTNPAAAFACAVIAEWMRDNGVVAPVRLPATEARTEG